MASTMQRVMPIVRFFVVSKRCRPISHYFSNRTEDTRVPQNVLLVITKTKQRCHVIIIKVQRVSNGIKLVLLLDVVLGGWRIADVVDLYALAGLTNVQSSSTLHVAQAVRIVVEVFHQGALQLKVFHQGSLQLEVLVEENDTAVPTVDDQNATVHVEVHVREVVEVVWTAEHLDLVARAVELADLEHVSVLASTPVEDDDRFVIGLRRVTWFHAPGQRDPLLQFLLRVEDEQLF